ncbi:Uncharacterized conserved protein YdbL, DUF1318 family [Maridesulfovibrio ferrireducens]|uniref:Uncharacterized conserved protein YdbL, DUF1318 family n=1 Tax=Maridesulfovibrio ferrireducens TaxID=246191 RepID=A0A1G9IZ06_9BACT|nr:DUF1318 domain-containing protein [Maridesulfovibrio ferrireducens]SDL30497.1 Uncharacterized conserved protein YdbL, DUF1318 family [Maridesulfovibrio ferrireducens]
MIKKTAQVLTLMTLFAFAACVTVNIYFPAAQVEKAAEDIVDDIYGTDAQQPINNKDSSSLPSFLAFITPSAAHAKDVTESDIEGLKQSNSAIRGLKQNIAADHQQLIPYYNAGNIGINKSGYLELINKKGLSLPDTAAVRRLISQDNNTRKKLYAEVAASMNIPGSEIVKITNIFTEVWQKKAPAGWWIQDASGNWKKK